MKRAKLASVLLLAALFIFSTAIVDIWAITTEKKQEFIEEVIRLVNVEREKVGLNSLVVNVPLIAPAEVRAQEAEVHWAHERPDGQAWTSAFVEFHFTEEYRGENLAYGQKTPEKVMAAWMKSPGHRKNILNPRFTNIAIGLHDNGESLYWCQLFFDNTSVHKGTLSASGYGPKGVLVDAALASGQTASGDAHAQAVASASDDVQQAQSGDAQVDQAQSGGEQRVQLIGARLYLRESANSKSKQIQVLNDGTEMTVLESQRGWKRVRLDDGTEGWVSDKYLVQK